LAGVFIGAAFTGTAGAGGTGFGFAPFECAGLVVAFALFPGDRFAPCADPFFTEAVDRDAFGFGRWLFLRDEAMWTPL
jgi:hypothetical protein